MHSHNNYNENIQGNFEFFNSMICVEFSIDQKGEGY